MKSSVLYIVNPISGRKGKKRRIIRRLQKSGCKIAYTRFAGDAVDLAHNAVEDIVVAVGGDGTVNEVARGLIGTGKTLGIIPCGSGDGLARHLGLSARTQAEASVSGAGVRALDWGTINGRPFFSVCGTGLDAIVSERFAKAGRRGVWTYVKEALATWKNFKPLHYVIDIDGQHLETDAVLITCGNSSQWGNGARITPLAKSDDGLLDVTVLKMFHSVEIPVLVWRLMTGSLHKSRRTICLRGKSIDIHCSGPVGPVGSVGSAGPGNNVPMTFPAHFDGDWFAAGPDLEIRIMPDPLRVLVG
ncbi:MAG: diacylglycerol kinase family lipid kinase [Bacteroidales bacterium]|nr:diacylglycerol kinase family lipid kinase [Bacteroidales bacterium]